MRSPGFSVGIEARLERYGLRLSPSKTRLFAFGRGGDGGERFDFLGFEFSWQRDKQGRPHVKRRTARKKLQASLQRFTQWIRENQRQRLRPLFTELNAKLRGYYQYYARKGYFTYRQRNNFQFAEFLKRAPLIDPANTATQTLWGAKEFICASEYFSSGRYLVFLQNVDAREWISINHHMGALRIDDETVFWPYARKIGAKISVRTAKRLVETVKAPRGHLRFNARITGSFKGLYNRWIPSQTHQVLTFDLAGRMPPTWSGPASFARVFVPDNVASLTDFEAWISKDGDFLIVGDRIDGNLIARSVRSLP